VTTIGITVTGTGSVAGVPDATELQLAAEAVAASVKDAVDEATSAVAAMRSVLIDSGVRPADLRSAEMAIRPDYDYSGSRKRKYVARFGLHVTLHDVDTSGAIAHAAVTAGGDAARLDGIAFIHSDPQALQSAAREIAFADARAKADQFATLAGQTLGMVDEIVEREGPGGPISPVRMMAADAAAMPMEAGEQQVSVAVTVRWAWA
jgi:uncharacterized protein